MTPVSRLPLTLYRGASFSLVLEFQPVTGTLDLSGRSWSAPIGIAAGKGNLTEFTVDASETADNRLTISLPATWADDLGAEITTASWNLLSTFGETVELWILPSPISIEPINAPADA